jgi:large subunit ribosomal protein L5
MKITGQKPVVIKSRQAISNFKLREGMPVMLKTTLRASKAKDFLKRLTSIVLPRIRDFSGISSKSFDAFGNYNLGLKSYALFPEFGLDDVSIPMGLQITITLRSRSIKDSKILMEQYGFIFNS